MHLRISCSKIKSPETREFLVGASSPADFSRRFNHCDVLVDIGQHGPFDLFDADKTLTGMFQNIGGVERVGLTAFVGILIASTSGLSGACYELI